MTPNPPLADAPFEGPKRRPIRREERATGRIEVATRATSADFATASRHSRRVRFLRLALPAAAVFAVAGYFVLSQSDEPTSLPVNYDNIIVGGDATVIERPRLTGYQAGGEAYDLEADRAVQRNDDPDTLVLEGVRATYELPGGVNAAFTAPVGEYNTVTTMMRLSGGLTMTLDNGIEARMETITVDVANGTITTDRPFALTADRLTIEGNTLDMTTDRMRVGGGVHTVLDMGGTP